MRLLVDTNIVLEVVLEEANAEEACALPGKTDEHEFFISDFSLHSIGILLFRLGRHDEFRQFLEDMVTDSGMEVTSLLPEEMKFVVEPAERFGLDFDDAYQYAAAAKHDLALLSFDGHFDGTERGRKTPADVLGTGE